VITLSRSAPLATRYERKEKPMQVIRIYTGEDAQTHFEELDIEAFAAIATHPGEGPIRCTIGSGASLQDWHNAPRRQYVMILSGGMEIETGHGEKRVLKTGDVLVAEDVTGKGHITRSIGTEQRVTVSIPMPG
jgi:quercetin dioxygenase-like cupin family protein